MGAQEPKKGGDEPSFQTYLADVWLPSIRQTIRPTTYLGYDSHVRNHLVPALGHIPLRKVGPTDLNGLYASLLRSGRVRTGGGLSANSVRRVHATLHRAFRDAVKWGLIESNPATQADPPRLQGHREMNTWGADELRSFLFQAKAHDLYPLWHLLAMTGLRRGEALGLRWSDVDFGRSCLSVRQSLVALGYEVGISSPKSSRSRRVVGLDTATLGVIAELRSPSARPEDFVFECGGRPLHPVEISKTFRRLVDGSGLPPIRLHDLRHTHATLALQAGVHPKIVSERLGHSTVALTLDIYSHCLQHMQHDAARQIAELVLSNPEHE